MSSSKSDDVTKFMCPSVVILISLEHSKHLKHDVLRELQGCLRDACLKLFGNFKDVSKTFSRKFWVLTESFKGVSRKFKVCFKEVSQVFQGSFRDISRVSQES